jgi:hypothetical protein
MDAKGLFTGNLHRLKTDGLRTYYNNSQTDNTYVVKKNLLYR